MSDNLSDNLFDVSVPVFVRALTNLATILKKGEDFAEIRKFDAANLLASRLAPDMHPLTRQIQMASDAAKGAGGRLTGGAAPSMPDTETTYPELYARISKTIDYLNSLDRSAFDGAAGREVVMKFPNGELKFTGLQYLTGFALPNFFFHVTTAYNILRHNGVALGKMDFLGGV